MAPPESTQSAARIQLLIALLMFAVVATVVGGLDAISRSQSVDAWLYRMNEDSCRQTRTLLEHFGYVESPDDQWIYEELPRVDFSRGGVYFLGASDVQYSTKLWELSPELQALVHNFAISASNHKGELVELRYLIEQRGMLKAGGEKSLVVLGVTSETAKYPSQSLPPAFVDNWERHGLFVCDPVSGIREVPANKVLTFMDFEEMRLARCLSRFYVLLTDQLKQWRHHGTEPPRTLEGSFYADIRRADMGPDWREKIDEAIGVFRELVDYLKAQHVQIRVVLMPRGSWDDSLPYDREYDRQIVAVCAEKQIPVSDWSRLLTDEEFANKNHPNVFGMEKIQSAFMDIAVPFLRSTHALAPAQSARN
ncbi:MAG: SGNH/GDSL hydrolase family protein [Verrucomicrobiia bacterium]